MSHTKRSQLIFFCNFMKNQWILMLFSLLDLAVNDTYDGMNFTNAPHLINVAALPCETQDSKNVILQ